MQYTCSGLQRELCFQNFRIKVTSIELNPNLFCYLPSLQWGTCKYGSTRGAWSPSHSRRFTPEEETRYHLYGRLGGYQSLIGWVRKISSHRGSTPRNIQPKASRYTDCTTPVANALCCWSPVLQIARRHVLNRESLELNLKQLIQDLSSIC